MRLDDPSLNRAALSRFELSNAGMARSSSAVSTQSTPAGLTDAADISLLSRALHASPAKADRIGQLRQQVSAGTYEPDAYRVSQGIIQDALSFGL